MEVAHYSFPLCRALWDSLSAGHVPTSLWKDGQGALSKSSGHQMPSCPLCHPHAITGDGENTWFFLSLGKCPPNLSQGQVWFFSFICSGEFQITALAPWETQQGTDQTLAVVLRTLAVINNSFSPQKVSSTRRKGKRRNRCSQQQRDSDWRDAAFGHC